MIRDIFHSCCTLLQSRSGPLNVLLIGFDWLVPVLARREETRLWRGNSTPRTFSQCSSLVQTFTAITRSCSVERKLNRSRTLSSIFPSHVFIRKKYNAFSIPYTTSFDLAPIITISCSRRSCTVLIYLQIVASSTLCTTSYQYGAPGRAPAENASTPRGVGKERTEPLFLGHS